MVPRRYKWVATQPWGEINLFEKKPAVYDDGDGSAYWSSKGDEISLGEFNNFSVEGQNWRETLSELH